MFMFVIDDFHHELQILKIKYISNQEILTFIHNYFGNKLPDTFDNYYKTFSYFSDRITRNSFTTIKIDNYNTDLPVRSQHISRSKKWNYLRNDQLSIPRVKKIQN